MVEFDMEEVTKVELCKKPSFTWITFNPNNQNTPHKKLTHLTAGNLKKITQKSSQENHLNGWLTYMTWVFPNFPNFQGEVTRFHLLFAWTTFPRWRVSATGWISSSPGSGSTGFLGIWMKIEPTIRAYENPLVCFLLIRPAIKPLFLRGVG